MRIGENSPKFDGRQSPISLVFLVQTVKYILWTIGYHLNVVFDNFIKLISMLVKGTKTWIIMAVRLLLFTVLLAPGWYRLLRYWFFDPFILRNVEYGKGAKLRNLMDIYLPHIQQPHNNKLPKRKHTKNELAPVVIFVSGGAWIIGYKLWSALVARGLAMLGMLVVVPDYRNFPQGDIVDMMEDIREATNWTHEHAHRFGGDSDKIVLAGQSAGAHICLSLLVSDYFIRKNVSHILVSGQNAGAQDAMPESLDLDCTTSPPMENSSTYGTPDQISRLSGINDATENNEFVDTTDEIGGCYDEQAKCTEANDSTDNDHVDDHDDDEGQFSSFNVQPMRQFRTSLGSPLDVVSPKLTKKTEESLLKHSQTQVKHKEKDDLWFSPLVDTSSLGPDDIQPLSETVSNHDHSYQKASSQFSNQLDVSDVSVDISTLPALTLPLNDFVWDEKSALDFHSVPSSPTITAAKSIFSTKSSEAVLDTSIDKEPSISVLDKVRLYVGISGPLDLVALTSHLHERGLDSSILHWICRGDIHQYSPALLLAQYAHRCTQNTNDDAFQSNKTNRSNDDNSGNFSDLKDGLQQNNNNNVNFAESSTLCLNDFVPVALFHGSRDRSIPCAVSRRLAELLERHSGLDRVWYREYEGWTHTDAILEAPLAGSADFFHDLASAVHYFTSAQPASDASTSSQNQLKHTSSTKKSSSNHPNSLFSPGRQKVETDDFAHVHHHHLNSSSSATASSTTSTSSPFAASSRLPGAMQLQPSEHKVLEPLAPAFLVQLARYVNPF